MAEFMSGGMLRDGFTRATVTRELAVDSAPVMDGVIDNDGIGTHQLVAAPPAGYAIRVLNYIYTCPNAATVQWKSGAVAKSGPMQLQSGVSAPSSGPTGRLFQCAEAAALNITVDKVGKYAGHFTYQLVEV